MLSEKSLTCTIAVKLAELEPCTSYCSSRVLTNDRGILAASTGHFKLVHHKARVAQICMRSISVVVKKLGI